MLICCCFALTYRMLTFMSIIYGTIVCTCAKIGQPCRCMLCCCLTAAPKAQTAFWAPTRSVYEELGKGKHSTVYKARRKKTIHYYAIKSVDIAQKSRVLQEVLWPRPSTTSHPCLMTAPRTLAEGAAVPSERSWLLMQAFRCDDIWPPPSLACCCCCRSRRCTQ